MRSNGVLLGAGIAICTMGGAAAHGQTLGPRPAQQVDSEKVAASARLAADWTVELESLRKGLSAAEERITQLERLVRSQQVALAAAAPAQSGGAPQAAATVVAAAELAGTRGGGPAPGSGQLIQIAQGSSLADGPVGEAPANLDEQSKNLIAALPDQSGVLTSTGHFVFEPSLNYTNSASNRLVFRGVEIVTGVQIGVLEADTAARDTLVGTGTLRYGLTRRSELELRVPYIHRQDRITTLTQREGQSTLTEHLRASDLGDIELTGRYQLNRGGPDSPIVVANLRVKSDTGSNPFEVPRDEFGVAQKLATGSGFWAIEPSISALIVTEPAVLFANLSWLHSFPKDINRIIGDVLVGRVEPGESIGASLGFGFSLNPRFSFSLGYRHNYIFRTKTELGGTLQKSESLQVGSLMLGMSYRVTPARSINTQFEFGVTSDAPNMSVTVRVPFTF